MDADQFVAMVKENIDDTPTEEDVRAQFTELDTDEDEKLILDEFRKFTP